MSARRNGSIEIGPIEQAGIGRRIGQLAGERAAGNPATFASDCQVDSSIVRELMRGRVMPDYAVERVIKGICRAIPTLSPSWLWHGVGRPYPDETAKTNGHTTNGATMTDSLGILNSLDARIKAIESKATEPVTAEISPEQLAKVNHQIESTRGQVTDCKRLINELRTDLEALRREIETAKTRLSSVQNTTQFHATMLDELTKPNPKPDPPPKKTARHCDQVSDEERFTLKEWAQLTGDDAEPFKNGDWLRQAGRNASLIEAADGYDVVTRHESGGEYRYRADTLRQMAAYARISPEEKKRLGNVLRFVNEYRRNLCK